jgi:cytidylate kinase
MAKRVVAIDGPAGAGKSTISRSLAERIGIPYLDTGAMYRAITVLAIDSGIELEDETSVVELLDSSQIHVGRVTVTINEIDVTTRIREVDATRGASVVAAMTGIRSRLRLLQREWVEQNNGGVVEGRDIATVVFPDACLKIFLTASPEERARRRVTQFGGNVREVAAAIAERDDRDASRADGPLRPASDALRVDTTGRTIADVVNDLERLFRERCGGS